MPSQFCLTACQRSVLNPAGPIGAADRAILIDAQLIMLIVVLTVIVSVLAFAWWFRAGNKRAAYRPDWTFSGRVEFITWAVPVLIILFLGGVTWIGAHRLDPAAPLKGAEKPIDIDVVSLDWKWLFIYPAQQIAAVNTVVLPQGVPAHFHITSATVMNSFFIPQLGSMIYAMNGMTSGLYLQGDRIGDYPGLSAHFSGDGFSDMRFTAHVTTQADFNRWITQARTHGEALNHATYAKIEQESRNVAPYTYRDVEPGLFHAIATQMTPPAPGPETSEK